MLDDIFDELAFAKRYSHYLLTTCMFHDDVHPSLLIYADRYYCQSCGAKGKTSDLLHQLQSQYFTQQVPIQPVRNPFNSWLRQDTLKNTTNKARKALKLFPDQRSYLYKRGMVDRTINKLGFGYLDGWYILPIIRDKQLQGALVRSGTVNMGTRYFIPHGQDSSLLFSPSWKRVRKQPYIILTYGVMDAINIHQLGFAAISTTSGKRTIASWFQDIRKSIRIFPDQGEMQDAKQLASDLGWRGSVINYKYPIGQKDPNDLYLYSKTQLRNIIDGN